MCSYKTTTKLRGNEREKIIICTKLEKEGGGGTRFFGGDQEAARSMRAAHEETEMSPMIFLFDLRVGFMSSLFGLILVFGQICGVRCLRPLCVSIHHTLCSHNALVTHRNAVDLMGRNKRRDPVSRLLSVSNSCLATIVT